MEKIKNNAVTDVVELFRSQTPAHRFLYLCAGAVFLPFPIACGMIIFVSCWALSQKKIRNDMFQIPGTKILLAFLALSIVVPLCYRWYLGVVTALGMSMIFLFLLFATVVGTPETFQKSMDICCIASIVPFIYAVFEKMILGCQFRSTGGVLNANYYGALIELVIIICVWQLIYHPHRQKLFALLIMMNLIGLYFCDCHSAWIPIIVAVAFLLFFSNRWRQGVIFLIISALFLLLSVKVPDMMPRLDKMPQTSAKREEIWKIAIECFKDHPIFGQGPMTYYFSYARHGGYRTFHAHNIYLDTLLNYGIVGASLLVSFFVFLYRRVFQCLHRIKAKSFAVLAIAATLTVLIHGFTDTTIMWAQTGTLFALILSGVGQKEKNAVSAAV